MYKSHNTSLFTVAGIANWHNHYGNECGEFSEKTKNGSIILSSNTTIQHLPKDILLHSTCSAMFSAALDTAAMKWKHPKCLSTDEWIIKFYSAQIKMKFVGKWIENLTLYLLIQAQKERCHILSSICGY